MNLRASALLACCALFALPAHADCQREPLEYDLAAQPMKEALDQLEQRTGCAIEVDDAMSVEQAPALSGTYSADEALWALLQGSGWEGYRTDKGLEVTQRQQRWVLERTAALRKQINTHATLSDPLQQTYLAELESVEQSVREVANDQGFVSAAEQASYRRSIEALRAAIQ